MAARYERFSKYPSPPPPLPQGERGDAGYAATAVPSYPTSRTQRAWFTPLMLLLGGLAAIPLVDEAAARADLPALLPRGVVQMIFHAEMFGDGAAVLFLFAAVWALDPPHRRGIVRLACATWGAGLAANVVKLTLGRVRPHHWLGQGADGSAWSQFTGLLPLGTNGTVLQSFPSAHTATAFGLALGLAAMYPQGRKFFLLLAGLTACQRVIGDMHYVSDTLVAAALAWCVAGALYGDTRIARRFAAWERRTGARLALPPVERRAA